MGSDLYELSFRAHRQHTRAEAIAQARIYGMNADLAASAFEAEDAWVELRVHERSVHPDAPVQWDRVGILRFVDEAVERGGGFAWEATPLALALPGLWGMSFDAELAKRIPVHLMEVEHTPNGPPASRRGSTGETVDFSVFLPQRFAPNLAGVGGLESRAWGGAIDWDTHHAPRVRRPRRALMKPLRRSVLRHGREVVRFDGAEVCRSSAADEIDPPLDLAPRATGGAWLLDMYGGLWAVTADGGAERVAHLGEKGRNARVKALAVDARGDVWIATTFGVFCKRGAGEPERVLAEQGALEAHAICVAPDGRLVVGTKKGVSIRGVDGAWTHHTDGFAVTPITGLCAMDDGVIWAAGLTGVTRINADGSRDKFGKRQGFEYTTKFIPLPDGSVLGSTSMSTARILAGASAAVPCPAVEAASPRGLVAWCLDGRGALHCSTGDGNILVLAPGEPPTCFVWSNTCDELRRVPPVPRAICFSPEGDLFCLTDAGFLVASAAELRQAREAGPLNTELRQFSQIEPLLLGPASPPAEGIDFQGKTVVITGTLATMTRAEAEAALVARGAKLSGTIGKGTDYLLAGLKAGSKLQKAEKLGVRVVGEDALRAPPAKAAPPAASPLSAADRARLFPGSDQPGSPTGHLDRAMMRGLAEAGPALTAEQWAALVARHRAFLSAGGAGGRFQVVEVSGLLLGVYAGGGGQAGDQADLQRKRVPAGLDARKASLSWTNACGALLEGADFSGADLGASLFSDAFLAGARFDGAHLANVDFSRADLRGVSFRDADLSGADFENADLTGADFTGARLRTARFVGARLDGVRV